MSVILETSCGDITIDLYVKERPRCCLNFLKLCKVKYYNFSLFHNVQRNLAAQTGDPDGTGRGGKSVFSLLYGDQAAYFEAETLPRIKHKKLGTISMVNGGNGVHGSQFFITLAPNIDYLDAQNHTVFGEVAEGFEVLNTLNETIVDVNNQPYKDIRIFHTVVLDDPFDDPPELEKYIPDRSPSPTADRLKGGRIGVDEEVDDEKGLTAEEVEERHKSREAKANAQILEMVGDLPDVDVKPPDNVLFVCKLNPVTSSEDLEIIFSRFGTIVSCEVIKDQKTQESLQYAFIEFEKPEDCEKAYFKMDNVLIDDRRIHVDFSQSVSKLKWQPKETKKDEEKESTQLRIKHPDDRRVGKYDLVFEDTDESSKHKEGRRKTEKETWHKHKREKSNSEDRAESNRHHKRRKHRSASSNDAEDKDIRNVKSSNSSRKRRSPNTPEQRESIFRQKNRSKWSRSSSRSSSKEITKKEQKHKFKDDDKKRADEKKRERSPSESSHDYRTKRNDKKRQEIKPSTSSEEHRTRRKDEKRDARRHERSRSKSQERSRHKDKKRRDRSHSASSSEYKSKHRDKKRHDRSPSEEHRKRRKEKKRHQRNGSCSS